MLRIAEWKSRSRRMIPILALPAMIVAGPFANVGSSRAAKPIALGAQDAVALLHGGSVKERNQTFQRVLRSRLLATSTFSYTLSVQNPQPRPNWCGAYVSGTNGTQHINWYINGVYYPALDDLDGVAINNSGGDYSLEVEVFSSGWSFLGGDYEYVTTFSSTDICIL